MIINGFYYPIEIWGKKLHEYVKGGGSGDCALCFCIGNRKAGKSVGIGLFALLDFFCYEYKTALIKRYMRNFEDKKRPAMENFWAKCWNYLDELPEIVTRSPLLSALYPPDVMRRVDFNSTKHELTFEAHTAFIDGNILSYPVALNLFNDYKNSNFENVHTIIYDEFISEDGNVLPGEVSAFYNIYDTIARGRENALNTTAGIFISNAITLNSPFFVELGIDREIRKDTKRLYRPNSAYYFEIVNNEIAANEMLKSPIARAMKTGEAGRAYLGYSQSNAFKDNKDFIGEKPQGMGICLYGFKIDQKIYYLWIYDDEQIFFTDRMGRNDTPIYAITTDDHGIDTTLLRGNSAIKYHIKKAYDQRRVIFDSVRAKSAFIEIYKRI